MTLGAQTRRFKGMSEPARKIDIEQLSLREKMDLMDQLSESVHGSDGNEDPNEIELAWQEEIARRVQSIREGTAEFVSQEEFLRTLHEDE